MKAIFRQIMTREALFFIILPLSNIFLIEILSLINIAHVRAMLRLLFLFAFDLNFHDDIISLEKLYVLTQPYYCIRKTPTQKIY